MMTARKTLVMALGVLTALLLTDAAMARTVTHFNGTRDQVRAACAKVGGDLVEGKNFTMCENAANGTTVECTDKGTCTGGSNPKRLGEFSPLDVVPPGSLSGSGDSAPAASAPFQVFATPQPPIL